MRALCEEFSHRSGIVVKFTKRQVPNRLPPGIMSCLYRIAQEGLRNAVKHSGAKHVIVRLVTTKHQITLVIRDDGAGFDLRFAKGKAGLGLASMEERIRLVDGNVSIESVPGRGASIVATAPLLRIAS
ncbi:MAG: ATP-binding protein [Bryobacteraceae bacterium]